ncbi:MAG: hypothetical protein LCH54_04305 [Bacteroidetes bacterium]|nr:hypothetical protein [Bacteroidota bacterium]
MKKNNYFLLFLLITLTGCSFDYMSEDRITGITCLDNDSSIYYIKNINGQSSLYYYHLSNGKLTEYKSDKNLLIKEIISIRNSQFLVYNSENSYSTNDFGRFDKNGKCRFVRILPPQYYWFEFSSNGLYNYGYRDISKVKTNSNQAIKSVPSFQIDKLDSSFNSILTLTKEEGLFQYFSGLTTDDKFLIYKFWEGEYDNSKDYRCVAIDINNPEIKIDLREKRFIENDNCIIPISDNFDAFPSRSEDSLYLFSGKYKQEYSIYSISTGERRELSTIGFNENKYSMIDLVTNFQSLPYQISAADHEIILIRNTETGKVIKIEPDRKPDEVIPLKIINPEKME